VGDTEASVTLVAQLILVAHVGHWLWLLYVPPVLVVIASIVKTTISERRAAREEREANDREPGR